MKTAEEQAYRVVLKELDLAVDAADMAANLFPVQIGGSARYKAAVLHARTVARDAVKDLIPNKAMEKLVKDYEEANVKAPD